MSSVVNIWTLPKGLQELFVFDPVGVALRERAAGACHELICEAARFDVLALILSKQGIFVKHAQGIGMSRTRGLLQALQSLFVKRRRAGGVALVAQDVGERGLVAECVGVWSRP